jgi:hypothetical protein
VKRAPWRAWRSLLPVLSIAFVLGAGGASASTSTGWSDVGSGGPLNGAVYALATGSASGTDFLLAGGNFTNVGGASSGHAVFVAVPGSLAAGGFSAIHLPLNGDIHAIAFDSHNLLMYAGGTFTDAGGNANADFLAVASITGVGDWKPACSGPPLGGSVAALQIVGSTLYVGGAFQNGAGTKGANYLVACDLTTGTVRPVGNPNDLNGGVYALAADANGTLYVGGQFSDVAGIPAADHIVAWDGAWHALGQGVPDYVRSLAASGQEVYVGTDSVDVAGIPQADHVARWNGSAWSALGANTAGNDGWLPKTAFIYAIAATSSRVVVTGSFQNADGNPLADSIASFDGTSWSALGSDGAGNGPWSGNGLAVAISGKYVYAGGNFTSAGGDSHASYLARYTAQTAPSNVFTLGMVTRNLRTGTATLNVNTPGPGTLTLSGAGILAATTTTPSSAGSVKLAIKAVGASKRQLDRLGHVKVKLTITFTPTGGTARSRGTTVVLQKRL